MNIRCLVYAFAGLFLVESAVSEPLSPATLMCSGCHGPQGLSLGDIPSLAGLDADYIEQVLMEYRTGSRASSVMDRVVNGMTEAEIRSTAEHYAEQ